MPWVILAHDVAGVGPTVVLLHSGVADRKMWSPAIAELAHAFHVVAPDLRGFGESPLPGVEFGDAEDVVALLDHLAVPRAAVVGSSLGGRVALELASTHPDRVSSLVLLCPAYRSTPRTRAAITFSDEETRLFEAGQLDEVVALNVQTWLGPEATDETRALLATMHRHAIGAQLAAESALPPPRRLAIDVVPADIGAPTVVVTGGQDMDHFRAVADLLAEQIPGADLVSLPWAGHLPSLERPAEMTALLLQLLRQGG